MKYNNLDIVIGVPALNEQTTIKDVISVLDGGLQKYYSKKRSLIILLDSNSEDETVKIFNSTRLSTPKLVIKNIEHGKGRNIINLLDFSIKNNAKCICMVDADIKNIKKNWVFKLINPILNDNADFVTPIYKRGKFAGNITNLICRPMLYGLCGLFVHQPIGGDFSFNTKYATSLLNKIKSSKAYIKSIIYGFGIDMFMTCQCLSEGYKHQEVDLGTKKDKPGLFHIDEVFRGECTSLFYAIASKDFVGAKYKKNISTKNFISEAKPYLDGELKKKLELSLVLIKKNKNKNKNKIYSELKMSELENKKQITSQEFNGLLAKVAKLLQSKNVVNKADLFYIINLVRPYFHLRVCTYFKEIKGKKPREVEKKLIQSCRFIRNKMLK